jgi:imidazolonepropionase-like amidohydrolase
MFGFMPGLAEMLTRQLDSEDEARAAIADLDRRRVDLVKLVLEPGFPGRALPKLKDEVFLAAMAEARRRKMRTTVHVGTDADAKLAIEAGAGGLEHTARGLSDDTINLMAAKKVTFTPTMVVLDWAWKRGAVRGEDADVRRLANPAILQTLLDPKSPLAPMMREGEEAATMARAVEGSLQQVRKAIRAGVPVLAGSDAGNPATFHGVALLRELELLAEAGMPLNEVLRAATSRAADRLGQSTLGRIAPGAVADLVVLDADPGESVGAYRKVRSVYLGGRKIRVP